MAINVDSLLIEKVISATMFNSNGSARWNLIDCEKPKISITASSKEKKDGMGVPIATYYYGKKAEISGDNSVFSLGLIAAQSGTEKEVAAVGSTIKTPKRESIVVGADSNGDVKTTIVLEEIPIGTTGSEVKYIYKMNKNKTLGTCYTAASTATATTFTIAAATKTITLPTDSSITAESTFVIFYDYAATSACKVESVSDTMPSAGRFCMYVLFNDICNADVKYEGVVEFPNATLSPECDIGFDTEDTYSWKISANKEYCSASGNLFNIFVPE